MTAPSDSELPWKAAEAHQREEVAWMLLLWHWRLFSMLFWFIRVPLNTGFYCFLMLNGVLVEHHDWQLSPAPTLSQFTLGLVTTRPFFFVQWMKLKCIIHPCVFQCDAAFKCEQCTTCILHTRFVSYLSMFECCHKSLQPPLYFPCLCSFPTLFKAKAQWRLGKCPKVKLNKPQFSE